MMCERCRQSADGLIGGFEAQAGAAWCVDCVRAAGIEPPTVLTMRYAGERTDDLAEWRAQKAAEKRAKFEQFLADRAARERAREHRDMDGRLVLKAAAGAVQLGLSL